LSDPNATDWLFWGLTLDGGWRYGQGEFARAPESDPWLDKQHGVAFLNAQAGPGDARFRANSPIGAQHPRGRFGELTIANFAGDGLRIAGAGGSMASAVSVFNVGGDGVRWQAYDDGGVMFDIGQTGRRGFYCGPNCANNRFDVVKIWYAGVRLLPGPAAGLVLDRADTNRFGDLQIQDPAGDGLVLDHSSGNTLIGGVQWQGQIPWMEASVAALRLMGATENQIALNLSVPGYAAQAYPSVK